ncbi:MAG: class I SAM-dependent methyltransferase [Deinococcales bacterium]
MADVEYDDWAAFILRLAVTRGWQGGCALDLGCGTGNATRPMVVRGVDVTGLDGSEAMLRVARRKLPQVRFHQGDFRTMAVPGRFSLVYSVFDALNNLLEPTDFQEAARRVHHHLDPVGRRRLLPLGPHLRRGHGTRQGGGVLRDGGGLLHRGPLRAAVRPARADRDPRGHRLRRRRGGVLPQRRAGHGERRAGVDRGAAAGGVGPRSGVRRRRALRPLRTVPPAPAPRERCWRRPRHRSHA